MTNSLWLKWIKRIFWMKSILILLSGCMSFPPHQPSPAELEKEILSSSPHLAPVVEEGSLWSNRGSYHLYSDVKARNVGDIVTISIVESAKASKNATTKTERDSGLEASWSGLFDTIAGNYSINGQNIGTSHKIDLANSFDGKGETTRTSYMSAYISARVIHVLPNGNLVIRGTRQVQVNNENQFIYIQGVIRPEDISSSNVILSTYVAEARIELNGQGPVSDKQSPGWLARIVDWAWPF
jgi:flagellar L-ring protein precursor FlgH